MRKELLVAIFAGTLFGVIGAFGIWRTNHNLDAQEVSVIPSVTKTESITPTVTSLQKGPIQPHILTPEDGDVVFTNSISIAGKSFPNTWATLSSESEDTIFKINADGSFQQTVNVSPGIHAIVFTSFDQDTPKEQNIFVVNSSLFTLQNGEKAKAYMGIVTNKTESSLQVKDPKGTILLVSVNPKSVSISRITDTATKDATYADIGIGDAIAALGIVGASDVLDAKRILITAIPTSTKRKTLMGKIATATRKEVTFTGKDGTEYSLAPTKSLIITKGDTLEKIVFSDLEIGQKIIATGTLDGTDITASRVQVVE